MGNLPDGVTDSMVDEAVGDWRGDGHYDDCTDPEDCECAEGMAEDARVDRLIQQYEDSRW